MNLLSIQAGHDVPVRRGRILPVGGNKLVEPVEVTRLCSAQFLFLAHRSLEKRQKNVSQTVHVNVVVERARQVDVDVI